MKVKLTEETLNAYISEAIKQELNEMDEGAVKGLWKGLKKAGGWLFRKGGKEAAEKKPGVVRRAVKWYGKNLSGNMEKVKPLLDKLEANKKQIDRLTAEADALTKKAEAAAGPGKVINIPKRVQEIDDIVNVLKAENTKLNFEIAAYKAESGAVIGGTGAVGGRVVGGPGLKKRAYEKGREEGYEEGQNAALSGATAPGVQQGTLKFRK